MSVAHTLPGPHPVAPPAAEHLPWATAREIAGRTGAPLPAISRSLSGAVGHALAEPLTALTDLPAFDTSAMDGWAVSGPGPWRLGTGGILAGDVPRPLRTGTARPIATGAPVPAGATAVLRRENGTESAGLLRSGAPLPTGHDIRHRAQECGTGATLLDAGTTVTPAVAALAAAAAHDRLRVHRQPTVQLVVTGSELTTSGIPSAGRVRDALGPLLDPALRSSGAWWSGRHPVGDDPDALRDLLRHAPADVIITTGGTSAGPTDLVHEALDAVGGRLLVDSVAVRPGHPMLLAELPPAADESPRRLVGLPGNPLAAVAGLVTLAVPLLRRLGGHQPAEARRCSTAAAFPGHARDVRLVPAKIENGRAVPLPFDGPAMLRGVALADALAAVPPGGVPAGTDVEVLDLPR
ncbi:molybdopterin molybdotransferase MoeA [Streptomyces sp. NPDC002514]|uniref:molybdopterin molybdotransferase MoeA n=1 Tax=Streptomyces sp. NPDC001270 TaxID=3364554 RepID=UPI00369B83D9